MMNMKTRMTADLIRDYQQNVQRQMRSGQVSAQASGGHAASAQARQAEKAAPLNQKWVERIFEHLLTIYGSKFTMALDGVDIGKAKELWARALAGYSADEIKRGLEACLSHKWPPTLPEFLEMCRGKVDYSAAFHEAVDQMIRRNNGQPENWPSKAHFWAAARIGSRFLEHPYSVLKDEWKSRLDKAFEEERAGVLPDIPERRPALPPKGGRTVTKEEALSRIEQMKAILAGKADALVDSINDAPRNDNGSPEIF